MSRTAAHHPVLAKFREEQPAVVPPEFMVDFLGTLKRKSFDPFPHTTSLTFNEEYFEWVDLLEAVVAAEGRFTMIELGAGFGRWLVRGARAVKQHHGDMPVRLVGVEAEPTHFQWMLEHFRDNGLDPEQHRLIEAAVDAEDGEVLFQVGSPYEQWGQAMLSDASAAAETSRKVRAVGLGGILAGMDRVDLIDLDVQGAEATVLSSVIDTLDRQVKRVHVGTHSHEIEGALRKIFSLHRWHKLNDYPCLTTTTTPWGRIEFQDGVQSWINPRLGPVPPKPGLWSRIRRRLQGHPSRDG